MEIITGLCPLITLSAFFGGDIEKEGANNASRALVIGGGEKGLLRVSSSPENNFYNLSLARFRYN